MTGGAYLVDTAVVAYAVGGDHPLAAPRRDIVRTAGAARIELHASVEMVQEFVFHRMRRTDRVIAVRQARDAAGLCVLHDFDTHVLSIALELIATTDGLGRRDAVHAATALRHGLSVIVSADHAFDRIPGIRQLDPTTPVDQFG